MTPHSGLPPAISVLGFQGGGVPITALPHSVTTRTTHKSGQSFQPGLSCQQVSVRYDSKNVLTDINLEIVPNEVTSLIGAPGSGKSSLLRCLNRTQSFIPGCRVEGRILLDGANILDEKVDVLRLRARVGLIATEPNPYPKSVYENVAYGPRIHGLALSSREESSIVEQTLRRVGLWKTLVNRLDQPALALSQGQQQLLCIARALAVNPSIIVMDEPCLMLDSQETALLEGVIEDLTDTCAVVLATHSRQQALRVSSRTAFLEGGRLIEKGDTRKIFLTPGQRLTGAYRGSWL